ncbi:MAG: glycosyltransferase family 4 protein [Geminicoccaceae bacterium]|nr:glycosyltransferase family 4 protein [Geminicoccaceae bacterium]
MPAPSPEPQPSPEPALAVLVKGWPRLSETFIAAELVALEARGLSFLLVSLRHPTDTARHPDHDRLRAAVLYLPEYLYQEPLRVLSGLARALSMPGFWRAFRTWLADLVHDPTPNRGRRFGQALVLAAELPRSVRHLHAHFLHTPCSVARYAALVTGCDFSISAHAKDVWTTPEREKVQKLRAAVFTVTCTRANLDHLRALAPEAEIELLYHGVDIDRFAPPEPARPARDGSDPADPVRILAVARAMPKKGLDTLLEALARLPAALAWRLDHIGAGPLLEPLRAQAVRLGIAERVRWHGGQPQDRVIARLHAADLFCLPARVAPDGDRDGLPNALLEAMATALPVIATPISAIPEAVEDESTGLLVPPDDADALACAILRLARDPALRTRLGAAGRRLVVARFSGEAGIDRLAARLARASREAAAPALATACASPSTHR